MGGIDLNETERAFLARQHARGAARAKRELQKMLPAFNAAFYGEDSNMATRTATQTRQSSNRSKSVDLETLFDNTKGTELERSSNFWKPRDLYDMITGLYAGKRDSGMKDDDGKPMPPIADIRQPDGKIIPVGLNAVLDQLLSGDLVGQYVVIQYIGDVPTSRNANPMRNFRVKVTTAEESAELALTLGDVSF